ncbi:phosphoribosyl-AMP cyclohydrolase [Akkermansia massiliensis]
MEQNDISSRIVFADRGKVNVEKGVEFAPKFDQNGLIPALAMDHVTHEPLMLAYMNAESLRMTMELGEAVYYSRSRQEIWHKGATSGHVQKVKQILIDCDQDALVVLVDQCGAGACHTGHHSCFYRSVPFGDELKAQPQGNPSRCVKRTAASFLMLKPYTARDTNSFLRVNLRSPG